MVTGRLRQWATDKGWKAHKYCVFGRVNGLLVTAFDGMGYKGFCVIAPQVTELQKESIRSFYLENRKSLKLRGIRHIGNGVVAELPESVRNASFEQLDNLVERFTSFLVDIGISQETCAVCNAPEPEKTVLKGTAVMRLCASCAARIVGEEGSTGESQSESAEPGSYLTGGAGALLGALVGSIPWVLVATYLNLMVAVLGYFIGWLSLTGYRLLRGKMGPGTPWIIGISTAAGVVTAQVATVVVAFGREGITMTPELFRLALTIPDISSIFYKDLAIGLFLGLLGVWSLLRKVSVQVEKAEMVSMG